MRAGGAEDAAAEPVGDEARQITAMVEVGVGENDRMDLARRDRQRLPVAFAQFLEPLEEPAVDQNTHARGVEEVLRAGDGSRGAEEG